MIGVKERRGRRCKELMDGLKEMRKYCKLKGEAQIALCRELASEEVMNLL